jgi:hypothetical protein
MGANVRFSGEEMRLAADPAWILTKNSVIRKVLEFFGELSGEWRALLPPQEPRSKAAEWDPKISRGEQYKGLPWVMLDYPRVFGKEDIFAIRTMFWWGHGFSVTLHVKGEWLRRWMPVILAKKNELEAAGFSPGEGDDEWEHEHKPGAWASLGGASVGGDIDGRPFLKLTAHCGLDRSAELPAKFSVLVRILIAAQPVK